jgi:hypothetical protein
MITAFGFYASFLYLIFKQTIHFGSFHHLWNLRVKDALFYLEHANKEAILCLFALLFLRLSISIDWIHTFSPRASIRSTFSIICIVNIFINLLFYTICIPLIIFACTPRSKIWNPFQHGTCINVSAVEIATGAFNLLLDLIMVAMPHMVIWRIQLSLRQKLAISGLFAVGSL